MKGKLVLSILLMFCMISFVEASGLKIVPQNISISKNFNQNVSFSATIINEEGFPFYNITVEQNPNIAMNRINSLDGNSNTSANFVVFGNNQGNFPIRIRGVYIDNVPNSNPQTVEVDLFFTGNSYELNPCDISIVRQDSVRWTNSLTSSVIMRQQGTNVPIEGGNIAPNNTFTKQFLEPLNFQYYFSIASFPIGPVCQITILNDTGVIANPNLDTFMNVSIAVSSLPTTLTFFAPITSYNVRINESADGVLTLTNSGSEVARNVNLQADWFSFSANNFDISPGQTRGIIYTIRPSVSFTNQTGINHTKTMVITGNFNTINQDFNIFIPRVLLNEGNNSINETAILLEFCRTHPTSIICQRDPIVEYRTINNGSDNQISFNLTQQQLQDLFLSIYQQKDASDSLYNFIKQYEASSASIDGIQANNTNQGLEILNEIARKNEESRKNMQILWTITFSTIAIASSCFIYYRRFIRDKKHQGRTW